eukprot:gene13195-biopygen2262
MDRKPVATAVCRSLQHCGRRKGWRAAWTASRAVQLRERGRRAVLRRLRHRAEDRERAVRRRLTKLVPSRGERRRRAREWRRGQNLTARREAPFDPISRRGGRRRRRPFTGLVLGLTLLASTLACVVTWQTGYLGVHVGEASLPGHHYPWRFLSANVTSYSDKSQPVLLQLGADAQPVPDPPHDAAVAAAQPVAPVRAVARHVKQSTQHATPFAGHSAADFCTLTAVEPTAVGQLWEILQTNSTPLHTC